MRFQESIQGLRGIAVLAVILQHLGFTWFSGGFIGVDIFFVISGYLITYLLLEEYNSSKTLSFSNFYARRVRRLMPAMLVTVIVTLALGFALLSDERYQLLSDSVIASVFSVSNIYFWSQVGYFDAEALSKPLLHTWSLGVEEQFYLIWPFLILMLLKLGTWKKFVIGLLCLALASFLLNAAFMDWGLNDFLASREGKWELFMSGDSSAFYLMPFRIFQFGIGAMLAAWVFRRSDLLSEGVASLLLLISLLLILYCIVFWDEGVVFPYYNALIVSVASAIAIYSSKSSPLSRYFLENRLIVLSGTLSYSLYLVHWPVIVYYNLASGKIVVYDYIVMIVLIFLLSYVLYRFVETPFRNPGFLSSSLINGKLSYGKVGIVTAITLVAVIAYASKEVDDRVPEYRQALSNPEWIRWQREKFCTNNISGFPDDIFTCQNDRGVERTIVVWGDSHANHLVAGMSEIFPDFNVVIAYRSGCISQSGFNGLVRDMPSKLATQQCIDRNHSFMEWAKNFEGDLIIFISNAKRNTPEEISKINNYKINALEEYGHKAYVLGDFVRPGVQLAQCYAVPDMLLSNERLSEVCVPDVQAISSELNYSNELEALSKNYIPVHGSQCSDGHCRFTDDEGRVTFRDHHHLSPVGSVYELSKLKSDIYRQIGISD